RDGAVLHGAARPGGEERVQLHRVEWVPEPERPGDSRYCFRGRLHGTALDRRGAGAARQDLGRQVGTRIAQVGSVAAAAAAAAARAASTSRSRTSRTDRSRPMTAITSATW